MVHPKLIKENSKLNIHCAGGAATQEARTALARCTVKYGAGVDQRPFDIWKTARQTGAELGHRYQSQDIRLCPGSIRAKSRLLTKLSNCRVRLVL